jgi:citrate lyase subunit beta/citryl-CoA lyase
MEMRPRRSVLYMPGSNARALEKARTVPADGMILDLEDAVAPDAKVRAREQVVAALKEGGYGSREVIARVNALDSPWGMDDVAAVAGAGPDAVLFPKVESAGQVLAAVDALDRAGGPTDLPIWFMAETPRSILNIDAIAAASPRLSVIVMGTSDLAKDMRVRHTVDRIGFLAALSQCVCAARAYGLEILDGVHLDLQDGEGLAKVCEQGRDLGFDGKTLIHPKQIEPANIAFAPSTAELESAAETIAAWEAAQAEGKGVVVVNGRLVENLHVEEARRNLALGEAIARMG